MIPLHVSRIQRTADALRTDIANGTWRAWLPPERELTALMLVGRNTLRSALRELAAQGAIESLHGSGHRILQPAIGGRAPSSSRSVGLLVPNGLQALRANQSLWIDQLRALLGKQGLDLQIHHGHRMPRDLHRHAAWVLVLCDADLQRGFAQSGIPCLLAGTPHPGVRMSFVDVDHRATCRHAAGALIARGHRRLAFLTRRPVYAGDEESERGFTEAGRRSAQPGVTLQIARHNDTRTSVSHALRRLLRSSQPPTALLVSDPHHCLTVHSLLAAGGKINSIGLVCRDDSPFLAHLVPAPARYTVSPAVFARNVFKLIPTLPTPGSPSSRLLQPKLVEGESRLKLVLK